jgi:hypothetical protein
MIMLQRTELTTMSSFYIFFMTTARYFFFLYFALKVKGFLIQRNWHLHIPGNFVAFNIKNSDCLLILSK